MKAVGWYLVSGAIRARSALKRFAKFYRPHSKMSARGAFPNSLLSRYEVPSCSCQLVWIRGSSVIARKAIHEITGINTHKAHWLGMLFRYSNDELEHRSSRNMTVEPLTSNEHKTQHR